jgi:hypothetical protein
VCGACGWQYFSGIGYLLVTQFPTNVEEWKACFPPDVEQCWQPALYAPEKGKASDERR